MLLRARFSATPSGTVVVLDASKKVPWAIAINPRSALTELERSIRMRAKNLGVDEQITGVAPGSLPPTARRFGAD